MPTLPVAPGGALVELAHPSSDTEAIVIAIANRHPRDPVFMADTVSKQRTDWLGPVFPAEVPVQSNRAFRRSEGHARLSEVPRRKRRTSNHSELNGKGKWWDGMDPVDLYGPMHDVTDPLHSPFANQFMWRVDDAITKYHPEVIYFDEHAGDSQLTIVNRGPGPVAVDAIVVR